MSEVYWQPGMKISDVEKQIIKAALKFYKDNKTTTAAALGISAKTLYNKLDEYKVQDDELQRRAEKIQGHQQASFLAIQSKNAGITRKSLAETPAEQPLPVQQREKIQEVPPPSPARINPDQPAANVAPRQQQQQPNRNGNRNR